MTPMTPSGWYSSMAEWLYISSPLGTRCGFSTERACRAAQSRCRIVLMISSVASSSGLPVSSCTCRASRPMYLVRCDFQASSRSLRSSKPSPAHHAAASLARRTAAATSRSPSTGKVASTSPVAGLTDSNVSLAAPHAGVAGDVA